jgi:hypothetical protein
VAALLVDRDVQPRARLATQLLDERTNGGSVAEAAREEDDAAQAAVQKLTLIRVGMPAAQRAPDEG